MQASTSRAQSAIWLGHPVAEEDREAAEALVVRHRRRSLWSALLLAFGIVYGGVKLSAVLDISRRVGGGVPLVPLGVARLFMAVSLWFLAFWVRMLQ